jgi:hypothetical protein
MRWLSERTILVLLAMFSLAIAAVLWQQQRLHHRLVESTADVEARRYVAALMQPSGDRESAGINRFGVGNERVLRRRFSQSLRP